MKERLTMQTFDPPRKVWCDFWGHKTESNFGLMITLYKDYAWIIPPNCQRPVTRRLHSLVLVDDGPGINAIGD